MEETFNENPEKEISKKKKTNPNFTEEKIIENLIEPVENLSGSSLIEPIKKLTQSLDIIKGKIDMIQQSLEVNLITMIDNISFDNKIFDAKLRTLLRG